MDESRVSIRTRSDELCYWSCEVVEEQGGNYNTPTTTANVHVIRFLSKNALRRGHSFEFVKDPGVNPGLRESQSSLLISSTWCLS